MCAHSRPGSVSELFARGAQQIKKADAMCAPYIRTWVSRRGGGGGGGAMGGRRVEKGSGRQTVTGLKGARLPNGPRPLMIFGGN